MDQIKQWLGIGSINLFGLPLSGKDTIGKRLANEFGGSYVSSGEILRSAQSTGTTVQDMSDGKWAPQQKYLDIVLPYLARIELARIPLILGGVGRWHGEERPTIKALEEAGHPIRAVILLDMTEDEIRRRYQTAIASGDRGSRYDDSNYSLVTSRIAEFREKTMPVLDYYRSLGLLHNVDAAGDREAVYNRVIAILNDSITQADYY